MSGWNIHFWEPSVSPHKLALVRALQAHPAVAACHYISETELQGERREQGWELGSLEGIDLRIGPSSFEIDHIITSAPARSFHIFSGIHWVPTIVAGLRAAQRYKVLYGVMSEPRADEGARGLLRLLHSWLTEGRIRRSAACVFAIGRNGPPWFAQTGYDPARIFPFAYFLPDRPSRSAPDPDTVTVAYLGRLSEAKGLRLFLDAVDLLPAGFSAAIGGQGPDTALVERAAAKPGSRLRFMGAIPMRDVPDFLGAADVLAVPSCCKDGWAAVVSEGLMAGAAVVATPQVGASVCLEVTSNGRVVARPEVRLLVEAVAELAEGGYLTDAFRQERKDWSRARLSGEAGARYLIAILQHLFEGAPRPASFYA